MYLLDGDAGGGGGAGDGGAGDAGGSGGDGGGGTGGGTGERQFTQAEVNAMMAREKDQGARSAAEQLAKDLGVPLDEAKDIIKQHRERSESEKSEAQRAREAADREKAEAEAAKAEAAREKHDARVERALSAAGVSEEKLARVGRLVEAEVGDDLDKIKAAVTSLKKDMPELFAAAGDRKPSGDPPGKPPRRQNSDESALDRGMKRAAAAAPVPDGKGIAGYDLPV